MSGWRGQTRKTVCSTAYVSQPCSTTLGRCLAPSPSRTTTARAARTVCGPTFVNDIEKCYLEWSPVLSPTPTLPNRLFQLPLSSLAPSPASTPAGRPSARSSSPSFGTAPRGPCGRMSVCPIGAPYTSDTIASSTSSVVSRHGLSLPLHAQRAACAGPSTGSTISRRSAPSSAWTSLRAIRPSRRINRTKAGRTVTSGIDRQIVITLVCSATASLSGSTRCRRRRGRSVWADV